MKAHDFFGVLKESHLGSPLSAAGTANGQVNPQSEGQ